MAQLPRFFTGELHEGDVTLDGSEAHHLLNVRRLGPGSQVELFDGTGRFATGEVVKTTKRLATLRIEHCQQDLTPATLSLAIAFPKPDRARWMVEKLTELGVGKVVPLITEHGVSSGKPLNVGKLQQYVIDACKQCRRNTLMVLSEPIRLADFLGTIGRSSLFVADQIATGDCRQVPVDATVAIGPEGGFSAAEQVQFAEHGATRVSFGQHILRVETAAVAAAVLFGK